MESKESLMPSLGEGFFQAGIVTPLLEHLPRVHESPSVIPSTSSRYGAIPALGRWRQAGIFSVPIISEVSRTNNSSGDRNGVSEGQDKDRVSTAGYHHGYASRCYPASVDEAEDYSVRPYRCSSWPWPQDRH